MVLQADIPPKLLFLPSEFYPATALHSFQGQEHVDGIEEDVFKGPRGIKFPCSEGCRSGGKKTLHLGQRRPHGTLAGFPLAISEYGGKF